MTIEELGQESIKHSEQLKTVFSQLKTVSEKMDSIEGLTLSVQKLAMSIEQLANNQAEDRKEQKAIVQRLIHLESIPNQDKANKYDKIADKIITVIVGAIVGYLLKSLIGI